MKMNPLKDVKSLDRIKEHLKERNRRDYLFFLLGIGTGLKLMELLNLQVRDISSTVEYIGVNREGSGEYLAVKLPDELKEELQRYVVGKKPEDYLLPSRKGENKPIKRKAAHGILKRLEDDLNLPPIGALTLRKTFGYHYYQETGETLYLQKLFNHEYAATTLRYIDITHENMNRNIKKMPYI